MKNKIVALPEHVKRERLRELYTYFRSKYKDITPLLVDLSIFFMRHDLGLAKDIVDRARIHFPNHPGLKQVEIELKRETSQKKLVLTSELQQAKLIRDTYVRLQRSGFRVSEIDNLLGRGGAPKDKTKDGFDTFNWSLINHFLDSYVVLEKSLTDEAIPSLGDEKLFKGVITAFNNGSGFSFIRLNDGEGAFIKTNESELHDSDVNYMTDLWWGKNMAGTQDADNLSELISRATESADVLGIPDFSHQLSDFQPSEDRYYRAYRNINTLVATMPTKDYVAGFLNMEMYQNGRLKALLETLDAPVSIISGHNAEALTVSVEAAFGVNVEQFMSIPSESRFSEEFGYENCNNEHYPLFFDSICKTLESSELSGKVFLVGAGFLGKYYCHLIKLRNGIAIDVGSVFDYVLGYKTRKFFQ